MNVLGRMVVTVLVAVVAPTIRPLPALGRDGAGPNVIVILTDDLGWELFAVWTAFLLWMVARGGQLALAFHRHYGAHARP